MMEKKQIQQDLPSKQANATIMVIDFSGYLAKTEWGGISQVPSLVKRFNEILLKKSKGVVIKILGNRTLYRFDSADGALITAFNIREIIIKYNLLYVNNTPITTMIALHTEAIAPDDRGISKDSANTAIFILSMAGPDEILLSEDTYRALSLSHQSYCAFQSNLEGKGKSGPVKIYKASGGDTTKKPAISPPESGIVETGRPSLKMQSTIDVLQGKLLETKGFPIMSRTMDVLMKLPDNFKQDDVSVIELTNTILTDIALTNKLLALVNTTYYSQQDGKVSTISRALMLLGFVQVRNTALSLMLFEDIHDATVAQDLKALIVNSLMSAVVSRKMAQGVLHLNQEEAFICSLLHELGKLLAAYFLPEENRQVMEKITKFKIDEEVASRSVLGMSYEELGMSVSKDWHLPVQITNSMHKLQGAVANKPENDMEKLASLATFSNEFSGLIMSEGLTSEEQQAGLGKLMKRYNNCFTLSSAYVSELVENMISEINHLCNIYNLQVTKEPVFDKLKGFLEVVKVKPVSVDELVLPPVVAKPLDTELLGATLITDSLSEAETILQKGLYDVTTALLGDFTVNDILRIVIEVIYRAMEFTRVIVCIRNPKTNTMEGRFGLGPDVARIIKDFKFSIRDSSDVFNSALSKNSDVIVNDVNGIEVKLRIPDWHKALTKAQTFVVLPIVVQKKPVGLIYAEKAGLAPLAPHNVWNLNTLRKQATIAFKQKI